MARAHFVKKARKANKSYGIAKGDSYYWWAFRRGGKHYSKTPPRRSQLTQSSFYSTMWDAEDELCRQAAEFEAGNISFEDLASACDDAASTVTEAGEECRNSKDNMPEGLQEGDTGQLLETRVENCETIAQALEEAAQEIRSLDEEEPEEKEPDISDPQVEKLYDLVQKLKDAGPRKDIWQRVAQTNWAQINGLNVAAITALADKHGIKVKSEDEEAEPENRRREAAGHIEEISWDCD